jgi:hypothetical protein
MLLPFYVTGRLERGEADRVAGYVARHPEIERQVPIIEEERARTIAANQAIPPRPAANFDRLAAAIATSPASPAASRASPGPQWRGFAERIADVLAMPVAGNPRWAGAAAVLLILAQAAATVFLLARPHDSGTYTTAEGHLTVPASGTLAVVHFARGATAAAIADMLAELDAVIVDGPKAGGLFVVRLGPADLGPAERTARLEALKRRSDVVDVTTLLQ